MRAAESERPATTRAIQGTEAWPRVEDKLRFIRSVGRGWRRPTRSGSGLRIGRESSQGILPRDSQVVKVRKRRQRASARDEERRRSTPGTVGRFEALPLPVLGTGPRPSRPARALLAARVPETREGLARGGRELRMERGVGSGYPRLPPRELALELEDAAGFVRA